MELYESSLIREKIILRRNLKNLKEGVHDLQNVICQCIDSTC